MLPRPRARYVRNGPGVQIAAELFVSPATVQTHVVNTLIKLGAKNRAHGIAIALQTGELDLGWTGRSAVS